MRRTLLVATLLIVVWIVPDRALSAETWNQLLTRADSLSKAKNQDSAIVIGGLALEMTRLEFGGDDTATARALHRLGGYNYRKAAYAQADTLWHQALAIRERVLGPDHPDVAASLNNLAIVYNDQGRYAAAVPLYERAIAINERALGPEHPFIAATLNNLANVYKLQGRYADSERLHKRALEIREKVFGPDHPDVANSLINLAAVYASEARYADAELLYKRALAIYEKAFGRDDPSVAISLDNLAAVHDAQGRFVDAEPLYKRALVILERSLGPNHPDVAVNLANLASLYDGQGRYADAEPLCKRALAIREKALGPDHPDVANSLISLAAVYTYQARYRDAELLYKRALAIYEKAFGQSHPLVASDLNNLAHAFSVQERFGEAESLYQRALAIWEKALSLDHPVVAEDLNDLAAVYRATRQWGLGMAVVTRAFNIRLKNFRDNSFALSEKDALDYSQSVRKTVGSFLSCYVDMGTQSPEQLGAACNAVLASKGIVSEGIMQTRQAVATETDSGTMFLVESLRETRFQVAKLYSSGPSEDTTGAYRKELDSLTRRANDLEGDLSRHSASYSQKKDLQNVTWERVTSLLPENSVLIEYLNYDYQQVRPDSLIPHYLAMVLKGGQKPVIVDMGLAAPIDHLVSEYRQQMGRVSSAARMPSSVALGDYQKLADKLYSSIWKPIEKLMSGSDLVFIAGDGALNLISFAGLPSQQGKYLVEDHPIQYLSSGRDLIRLKDTSLSAHGLLAIGNPDFDAPPSARVSGSTFAHQQDTAVASYAMRNVRSGCGSLSDIKVEALPGTRTEIEQVASQWKSATTEPETTYEGAQASEDNVKKCGPGSRVLHLATHGYFLEGACQPHLQNLGRHSDNGYIGENPLLLSGLLLAGANLHGVGADSAGIDDGILSAYEVSGMDLKGTDLVVLSACETGLGEVKQGEGVYGLRRAFQMAGARTVISALWPVGDQTTSEMMGTLYSNTDRPLYERIRQMQLDQIKKLRSAGLPDHPFLWAGFIATGDWR